MDAARARHAADGAAVAFNLLGDGLRAALESRDD